MVVVPYLPRLCVHLGQFWNSPLIFFHLIDRIPPVPVYHPLPDTSNRVGEGGHSSTPSEQDLVRYYFVSKKLCRF